MFVNGCLATPFTRTRCRYLEYSSPINTACESLCSTHARACLQFDWQSPGDRRMAGMTWAKLMSNNLLRGIPYLKGYRGSIPSLSLSFDTGPSGFRSVALASSISTIMRQLTAIAVGCWLLVAQCL